ncbi:FtsX-like permease family protein [Paractinoplanes lichenicola]|uniref:FtsX-like permease family protein n=1 Tax=Paractinoplanes lichenicola TaxID=2802976 RepID=A0ABS1W0E8_9ACTN|nr:FtsX-like permease family protein [Actinoplanes lichenicola]MBL7260209.1 FtsX-like permease family protein [Actinoplanes lichenicola]
MTTRYVLQALRRRPAETLAAALAVALTVAFLVALGSFTTRTGARLTERAAARVPVDWQVQVTPGSDPAVARDALAATPGLTGFRAVDYAKVRGLTSKSADGQTRTTGAAYVVSLPADYASFAPGQLRTLGGSLVGAALQQQTAANLAAAPGDTVTVLGSGRTVAVTGVAELPTADSFFQVVGAPAGSGASAPPDNVLLVAPERFRDLVGSATVIHQFHVRLNHGELPSDPARAADLITLRSNHLVADIAGSALIGDNLEVALSAAREDAIYAGLLVLLLGVPALVLAGVVALLLISLRNDRQRRDLALLRLRGVTPRRAATLLGLVALIDGLLGAALGAVLARALGTVSVPWLAGGTAAGVLLAVVTELAPVARLLRGGPPTVQDAATALPATRSPLPLRLGLDFLLLAGSAMVFWLTSRGGYKVVVVPEGVPVASVNYAALLAPALLWPGMALLTWRLSALVLARRGRRPGTDPSGRLPDLRRDVLRRRRRVVARGATGLAVAVAVTVSAAVFTTTYDRQARVDTALTVGSDVAITLPADSGGTLDPAIAAVPGVTAVEQVSHRLVYVGPDLQDLYGVDAATVGRAAPLEDAFTPGSSVRAVMANLAATRDGVLLSQETLHDYQLHTGDAVRLRLRTDQGAYRSIGFHVVGVITEFATAPRDSFVVANRSYLAEATGRPAVETLLVRTGHPARVAAAIRPPTGAQVNDTTSPRVAVVSASGLAAGSLSGLARLSLTFGLLLAGASAGLVLVAGAVQRRRATTALAVLGATARQRAGFLWTEARALVALGVIGGLVAGGLVAAQLIKVLNGIFDPPPHHPVVPWDFVAATVLAVLATAAATTAVTARWTGRVDASRLRDL